MPRKSIGEYPPDWREIAHRIKEEAGWKCVRCGHPHDPPSGYCLTVHHLDMNPSNNRWHNTPALCQRCHLSVQARVVMARVWMFEHSEWFKPYVAGYYAHLRGLPDDRDFVLRHLDELLVPPAELATITDRPGLLNGYRRGLRFTKQCRQEQP